MSCCRTGGAQVAVQLAPSGTSTSLDHRTHRPGGFMYLAQSNWQDMPASPILLLPFQITVWEQLTSRALIISSFSGMCNNCRVQTPSRRDDPRELQPVVACSLKTDLLWDAAPSRPEVCTHTWGAEESPRGAATVTQSLRLCRGKTNKQKNNFEKVSKQWINSPWVLLFFFFLIIFY